MFTADKDLIANLSEGAEVAVSYGERIGVASRAARDKARAPATPSTASRRAGGMTYAQRIQLVNASGGAASRNSSTKLLTMNGDGAVDDGVVSRRIDFSGSAADLMAGVDADEYDTDCVGEGRRRFPRGDGLGGSDAGLAQCSVDDLLA